MMPEINICKSSQKSVLQITSFDQIQSSQDPVYLRELEKWFFPTSNSYLMISLAEKTKARKIYKWDLIIYLDSITNYF